MTQAATLHSLQVQAAGRSLDVVPARRQDLQKVMLASMGRLHGSCSTVDAVAIRMSSLA